MRTDNEGRIIPASPRTKNCSVCDAKLEPTFKATRKAEDWFWRECDTCLDPVCQSCSDEDEDGVVECSLCYQTIVWRKRTEA